MKRCLITGAAEGIGRALAHRFAAADYAIVGLDINPEQAAQTRSELIRTGTTASFLTVDLAQEEEIDRILLALQNTPPLDVVIHNAGISAVGPFATSSLHEQQAVIDINLLAPLYLTAGLLKQNSLKRGGHLVFISSLSHFASYPGAAVYAASKDGLASYARSLSVSLAGEKIQVLTVFPGPTRTAHARRYSPDNRREAQRMPPNQVANDIFLATQRGQRILIPGLGNKFFANLGHFFPALTEWFMKRTILDKLK